VTLDELLSDYWDAAYSEGIQGRTYDTPESLAQKTLCAIHAEVRRLVAAERERCAKVCDTLAYECRGDNGQIWECAEAIREGRNGE
jgi:hypothetical protein